VKAILPFFQQFCYPSPDSHGSLLSKLDCLVYGPFYHAIMLDIEDEAPFPMVATRVYRVSISDIPDAI